jgi:hypothetical protein
MKNLFPNLTLLIACSSALFAQTTAEPTKKTAADTPAPAIEGWRAPNRPKNFDIYLDSSVRSEGGQSASIKSNPDNARAESAVLMQTIKGDNYRGRRVRLSVYAKTENVGLASFWLRMDGEAMQTLNLDAMSDRPLRGTTDWKRYNLVLDVPAGTRQIVYGIKLAGAGQIWIDDLKFETVGPEIPVTTRQSPSDIERASLKHIEEYKITNKADYENQLRAFAARNETAAPAPVNLNFEN